ncbi:glycosyl hydrolase [Microbacterium panaciterrae]|uniref:Beta-galactosidase n=1 Tax=Microbacterium panaciterrae TaxID=985759 RepID=A0ABP8PPX5_9MICO
MLRDHPNWRFSLDWQRAIVGGAHQGGSTRISTELGAQFGAAYALTLGVLKQMLDKEWAAGITRPFVHGYASQSADATWPTESRFFDYVADSWNDRHFPEWKHWQPLTDYWSRGTMILETGVPRTDIAIYREGFLTTAARGTPEQDATAPARLVDAEPLERSGYTVQFIDPLGLEDASPAIHAGRLFPEGPGYRAVILDEREIDLSTAQALDTAASRGLAVLFVGEMPALAAPPGGIVGDPRQERVIQDLLRHPNALRVPDVQSVPAALDSLGVRPQVAFDGDPVLTQWRETSRNSYLLVYNTEHRTICTDLDVEGHWEANEIDLWSADIRAASLSTVDGGTTRMSVDLGPLELRVFELRRAARGMLLEPRIENDSFEVVDLNSAWSLEVTTEEASGARIIHLDGQGPRDWRDIAELCDVSGTGIYRIPVGCVSGAYVAVELGELAGSATVRVDGRPYGTVYVSGGSVNVGAALAEGGLLEIEVRTPLRNAVAAVGTRL